VFQGEEKKAKECIPAGNITNISECNKNIFHKRTINKRNIVDKYNISAVRHSTKWSGEPKHKEI
jgi:hypothetical protein